MAHIEVTTDRRAQAPERNAAAETPGLVHIVGADNGVAAALSRWMAARGFEVAIWPDFDECLYADHGDAAQCIVVDAQILSGERGGVGAYPWRLKAPCTVVVMAHQPDTATVVAAMKTGVVDFLEKPLREPVIVAAVSAAIEIDRNQRCGRQREAMVRERFTKLSRREREVMALVTQGRLNKQVGGALGLSEITVKAHRGAVMRKMGARTFVDLVHMADNMSEDLAPLRNGC